MEQQMEYINQSGHTRSARNFVEENNPNDKSAVKLVRNDGNKEQCVGHVPIEHSKVFFFFLKRGGKLFATVTGNKFFNIGL